MFVFGHDLSLSSGLNAVSLTHRLRRFFCLFDGTVHSAKVKVIVRMFIKLFLQKQLNLTFERF